MIDFPRIRLSKSAVLRVLADIALLQLAMLGALAVRFYIVMAFQNDGTPDLIQKVFGLYQGYYQQTAIPLTLIVVVVSFFHGFYNRGRFYQGKYKILIVTQSVTWSFLLYGLGVYFLNVFDGESGFARAAFVLAWFFSIVLLAGARVWSFLWRSVEASATHEKSGDNKRVLVIGGGGYIGSALVPRLLDSGYRVRVLDIMMFGKTPLASVLDHPNFELMEGDFRRNDQVVEAMRDVDSVVHLGAIVGDPACSLDESFTIEVNLAATLNVAQWAKQIGVKRFIFASTCSVYGACEEILDERSEVQPVSLYGNTKYGSEKVLREMSDANFKPTILRFGTIYGLSGRTRFDLVVNLLSAKAKMDGEITIVDGDQWRPFVHVDDAARAVAMTLGAPHESVANETINVGSNEQNYRISDIGNIIQEQVITARLTSSESANDPRNYRVDFSKIERLLGFAPEWTVRQGIRQVLEAIASGKVTDYTDPQYSNVKFLTMEGTDGFARDKWARELIDNLSSDQ